MTPPADLDRVTTEVVRDDNIAVIRLDDPGNNNIIDSTLLDALEAAIGWADEAASIDGIVLGTTGDVFCAGADVEELSSLGVDEGIQWLQEYFEVVDLLRETGKPTVAAVQGACVAGGNELALGCDLIVAGASARFGQPEVKIGSTAAAGGLQMLPLIVGERRAREMLLTGRLLEADEAEEIGLINRVVDDEQVDAAAIDLVEMITREHSPQAYRVMKSVFKSWHNLAMLHWEATRDLTAAVWASDEFQSRAAAFLAGEEMPPGSFSGIQRENADD